MCGGAPEEITTRDAVDPIPALESNIAGPNVIAPPLPAVAQVSKLVFSTKIVLLHPHDAIAPPQLLLFSVTLQAMNEEPRITRSAGPGA